MLAGVVFFGLAAAGYKYFYEPRYGALFAAEETNEKVVCVDSVARITGVPNRAGWITRYPAVVQTGEEETVKTDDEKQLLEICVKKGDRVKAGDPIFLYDLSKIEQEISEKQLEIEQKEMENGIYTQELEEMKRQEDAARTEGEQLEVRIDILDKEKEIKGNESEIRQLKQQIEDLEKEKGNPSTISEVRGTVTYVGQGESSQGDTDSEYQVRITKDEELRLKGKINELHLRDLAKGDGVIIYSRSYPVQTWKGQVTMISNKGESGSSHDENDYGGNDEDYSLNGTSVFAFEVKPESSQDFLIGQHVYIEKDEGQTEEKKGLWIDADYLDLQQHTIWVEDENSCIKKRTISLGEFDEASGRYKVLDGLTVRDYIAIPGQDVIEGQKTLRYEQSND